MPLATRSKRSNKGFTLIELIIVVAIAAILAGMAIASYQNSVQKSRRVDAKSTLLQIAALQEKQYFQQNSYSNDLAFLYGGTVSPDDHYNLSVDTTAATTLCSVDGACFVLTATATGAQAGDASCQSFTLTNTGLQQAFDGTSNDTTDLCW